MGVTMTDIGVGRHQQAGGTVLGWYVGQRSTGRHDCAFIGSAADHSARKMWWELRAAACEMAGDTMADRRDRVEALLDTDQKANGWDPLSASERNAIIGLLALDEDN